MGNENMTVRRLAFDTLITRVACSTAATVSSDIDEVAVSHLSPMASNMLDQIGEKNLPDLLAYLMQRPTTP